MTPFHYQRATDAAEALTLADAGRCRFLGGGTNLVDLMRQNIEAPAALVDVSRMPASIEEEGPRARLLETLIFRHLADALYDGRLEERIDFIRRAYGQITAGWTEGDLPALAERARAFSDAVEYDDEALEAWIGQGKEGEDAQ